MDRSRVAIIIPALNEAATIGSVLANVMSYGIPIVVDDGSTDATAEIARMAGACVVQHESNQGYDGALRSGFMAASQQGYEYAITMDADGQHNPEQLSYFIARLEEGYDLVLGVRDRRPRVSEALFAIVGRLLWRITDPLCGMKGYRIASYQRIGAFGSFKSIGTELAVRIVVQGGRCTSLPVLTHPRADMPRFGNRLRANLKIFRAMITLIYLHVTRQLKQPIYVS